MRYLGEEGSNTPLVAAVSMCNPLNLTVSDQNFQIGINQIYNWNLASSLKKIHAKHKHLWVNLPVSGELAWDTHTHTHTHTKAATSSIL